MHSTPDLLTEHDAARYLGYSYHTLRDWRRGRGGAVPGPRHVKHGRTIRYDRRDLDAWQEARQAADAAPAPEASSTAPAPRLLREREAAAMIGFQPATLRQWRMGRGYADGKRAPRFIRCGRSVRYDLREIEDWIDRHTAGPATREDVAPACETPAAS